ncbi:hypothetical protein [Halomonas faecis]|uniref:hypothetical protein n=1 Tax=Halomonas faecis TaxID=1562110 RepID=UPI0013D2DC3F|nr:hypothetical protein [Halomonas faecis]
MSNGDEKICEVVRGYIQNSDILDQETEIQHATKFKVKSGAHRAGILVYNSGKIHVEGADSDLKNWCLDVKKSIEDGTKAPGVLLPEEIETLPQRLQDRVPACDGVVIWFYQEALRCYKAGSPAGAAFMLGAASEKAILLLIEGYKSNISDERNRERFASRVGNRMLSVKFDEFKRSYRGSAPKPDAAWAQDLEQMLDGAFNFYRSTRNQVGHPQIIPDLDEGVILANIGQFIVYVERIYYLIEFFEENDMRV